MQRPDAWTSGTQPPLTLSENQKVSKLQASGGVPKTGLNALLRVIAGDKVRAKVDYYYVTDPGNSGGSSGLSAMLNSLASALTGDRATQLSHSEAGAITTSLNNSTPLQNLYNQQPGTGNLNAPKAYMNWIFFDEQFNFVEQGSGFLRVQQAGNGATALVMTETKAIRNGYVYVYLSNESNEPVYFDNFTVSHDRGQLIGEDHYYAYGLKIAAISSKSVSSSLNSKLPKYGYQGAFSEETSEFELNYNEFFLRTYDPQIGRWTTPDPYDQFGSPYLGMGTDPANGIDPTGGIYVSWPPPGMNVMALVSANSISTTASTLNSTLTNAANGAALLSTAGCVLVQPSFPGGWIGVSMDLGDRVITKFYYNDLSQKGNAGGKKFVKDLSSIYKGKSVSLFVIGYEQFDYEDKGDHGRNIRLNPDGSWVDRSSEVSRQAFYKRMHVVMDIVGIAIPFVNVINAAVYMIEGDANGAKWALASVIPLKIGTLKKEINAADDIIKGGRDLSKPVIGTFKDQAAQKFANEAVEGTEKAVLNAAKTEMHHLLPQAKRFRKHFERAGLDVEDFKIPLDKAKHRLKPNGIHTNGGGNWNKAWDKFFRDNPAANKDLILDYLRKLRGEFGI